MKPEFKKVISFVLIYLAMYWFSSEKLTFRLFSCFIFLCLFLCWKNSFSKWLKNQYQLFKKIRERKYFFVTEKGYKTDFKKRRDLGNAVYLLTNLIFIALLMVLYVLADVFSNSILELNQILISGASIIALFGILFSVRNYLTSFYYYLVPWVALVLIIDYISFTDIGIKSTEASIVFVILAMLLYMLLTIVLPVHSLRKIADSTWIFGVLTSIIIPLGIENIFNSFIADSIENEFNSIPLTLELLESLDVSQEIILFIKDNPYALEFINKFRELILFKELNSLSSDLSAIRFLLLSAYSIGFIIINLKIKLGKSKAKDIYLNLKDSGNPQYDELRDCIFYGGTEYEDKIMANRDFENIIVCKERTVPKFIETRWWIVYPTKCLSLFHSMLKKSI